MSAPNVVGVAEFAGMARVAKQTVSSWVSRGTAPPLPPSTVLASGRVWNRSDVAAWLTPVEGCSDCSELGRNCGR